MHSGDVGVQRAACAVLNEMAVDTESAELIERDNGLQQLYELTQQVNDEKIRWSFHSYCYLSVYVVLCHFKIHKNTIPNKF